MSEQKPKQINLKHRNMATKQLGSIVPSLVKKIGGAAEAKKSSSMIRIINQWHTIMGDELAPRTQAIKVLYKKQMNKATKELEPVATLRIKADSALSTVIAMRQFVILDRLNRLFSTDSFKKIDIIHGAVSAPPPMQTYKTSQQNNKKYDIDLSHIDDPIIKSRLESLGQAVMNSAQNY